MILHDVETKTHVAATWFLTDAKTATRDKIKTWKRNQVRWLQMINVSFNGWDEASCQYT